MDIETRLTNLEKLVNGLSKKIDNFKFYQDADNAGMRKTEGDNTNGVKDNSDGLFEIAETVGEDSDSIMELANMVADLEARVEALEEA